MQTRSTCSRCLSRFLLLTTLVAILGATGCSNLPRQHWWQFWRKKPTIGATVGYNPDNINVPPPPDAGEGGRGADALNPGANLPTPPGGVTDASPMRRAPAGTVSELKNIFFDYDSSEIAPQNQAILDANAAWLTSHPGVEIQIEGHCDERGTTEYNFNLGDRRAKSVKAYLMGKGVQGDRLHTTSYGKDRPVDPQHGEGAWAKNRRVQFLVY